MTANCIHHTATRDQLCHIYLFKYKFTKKQPSWTCLKFWRVHSMLDEEAKSDREMDTDESCRLQPSGSCHATSELLYVCVSSCSLRPLCSVRWSAVDRVNKLSEGIIIINVYTKILTTDWLTKCCFGSIDEFAYCNLSRLQTIRYVSVTLFRLRSAIMCYRA